MNQLKKMLFRAYVFYEAHMPIHKGKFFLGRLLYKMFGLALFTVEDFNIELNPVATFDRAIMTGRQHGDIAGVAGELDKLKHGEAFLDVGANIGYFSLFAASRGIEVFAFEPSPREIKRMRRNMQLSNFSNITLFEQGLSDKPEMLSLRFGMDYNPGQNSVIDYEESVESVQCRFAPLSSFITPEQAQRVRLCKIDVEGFEIFVLRGMEEYMPYMGRATFVVEITPRYFRRAGYTIQDVYNFFAKYGYTARNGLDANMKRYDEVFAPQR